jgi:O-antigen/teichoic acid export membrane protein
LTPVSFVLLPVAARMMAAGSVAKLRTRVVEVVGITLAGTVVLVLLLEVFAGTIVDAYLGPGFAGGVGVLRLTLLAALPWGAYITLRSVIDAKHVLPVNARNMIITFATFAVLTVILRSVMDTTQAPLAAFVASIYVLAILTLIEVYRITRTGDAGQVPETVTPDLTAG